MSSEQPKIIYRYQRFSDVNIDTLCHDQLYFANPASFNDPLDCQPSVESDSNKTELRLILTEQIRRRVEAETLSSLKGAKVTGDNAVRHAKNIAEQVAHSVITNVEYNATNPDYEISVEEAECGLLTYEIQSELLKQYDRGICCFASTVENPLLWSHYGDQHRGFCVGYNLDRKPKPNLHKVIYGGTRTIHTSLVFKALLEKDVISNEILDRDVLLRKASPWRYEREWRLLGNRGIQDSVLSLQEITFGLRCPIAIVHAVITSLQSRVDEVDFYEIYQERGSFKLKKRIVDAELSAHLPRTARSGIEIFGSVTDE
ncbi:MAG: DUF2971 domain-containing protein [Methylococcales bacterium]